MQIRKRTKICRNQSLHAGWTGASRGNFKMDRPVTISHQEDRSTQQEPPKNPKPITSTPRTPESTGTNRLKPTKNKKKTKAYRPARSDQGSRFTTLKTATKATQEEHPARARVSLRHLRSPRPPSRRTR